MIDTTRAMSLRSGQPLDPRSPRHKPRRFRCCAPADLGQALAHIVERDALLAATVAGVEALKRPARPPPLVGRRLSDQLLVRQV